MIRAITVFIVFALAYPVEAATLVVGQVAPVSDVTSPGSQLRTGMQLYFDAVNQAGGVHGASIKFIVKDRGLKSSDAVTKTRELLQEAQPVALAGLLGTGPMEELVKSGVLSEHGIPVVGIRTGAVSLHDPVNPFLFHTRASYLEEVQKIATQLTTIGLNRTAVFYEDSAFGKEVLNLFRVAMKSRPAMELVESASYKVNTTDVADSVRTIFAAKPQSILVIGTSAAAAEFYKALRETGSKAQVFAL